MYSKLSAEIFEWKNSLFVQLDQAGKERLEQLTDAYMRQENAVLCDAFVDSFWTAVKLMLEFER